MSDDPKTGADPAQIMRADFEALSRHALRCAKWSWRPGMRVIYLDGEGWARVFIGRLDRSDRLVVIGESLAWVNGLSDFLADHPDARPDMSDPATLGALRGLIGELNGHGTFEIPPMYFSMYQSDPEASQLDPLQKLAGALVMELGSFSDDDQMPDEGGAPL